MKKLGLKKLGLTKLGLRKLGLNFAIVILANSVFQFGAFGQTPAQRPRILGIDHVAFYTTNPEGVKKLYGDQLGLASAEPIEPGGVLRYMVGKQWVGFSPALDLRSPDRMDHVAWRTNNIAALRTYLIAQGITVPEIQGRSDHSLFFVISDPEGHRVEFVERAQAEATLQIGSAVSRHIIHAGFLVYHREAEDHFYRDILGFRPYWHGGMKDDVIEWMSLQVPDGTDWIEYMVNQPAHPNRQLTGVMNHVSLGVADIKKAQATLEARDWKPHGDEKAQLGRDGKWQLNLYDPDQVRVELMEFKPVQKPCCSEFTGTHPTE
ncbi:MAG TPA: VOC family protein [Candidatus Sulfotelmatobacter sp.]|jgi:catechol 2,3-dioxygenase-like lactoylglutathione lyase family enzyme